MRVSLARTEFAAWRFDRGAIDDDLTRSEIDDCL